MARIWIFSKKNFDLMLTITGAIIVAVLGFLNTVTPEIVSAATLMILSLIAISLLVNRATTSHLQQVIERIQSPSAGQVLLSYKECMEQIEKRLVTAREVRILSRTCRRLWEDNYEEFKKLFENGGIVHLMLVDPNDGAVKMIASSVETWDNPNDPKLLARNIEFFLERLVERRSRLKRGALQVRTIDYLPAWTLILIDSKSDNGMIFVEIATYSANSRSRPTFLLTAEKDEQLFRLFQDEFDKMWECGSPAETVVANAG